MLQILTVSVTERFRLLEPFSLETLVLLALFLGTSLSLLATPGRQVLVALHLLVVSVLALAHPLSDFFGRDGSLIVIAGYGLAVLWLRTAVRVNLKLLASSFVVGLLLLESGLSTLRQPKPSPGVLDYQDVMGPYGEGGFLIPNLNVRVVGETRDVAFVTERHGFRNRDDVPRRKPAGTFRVFFTGDSFVAGYRTDQERTVGRQLELALRARTGRRADVLVAGSGHPGASLDLVRRHAFKFEPDLVLVGVTLGNDMAQSWMARRGYGAEILSNLMLPATAFKCSRLALLPVRLERSLRAWRTYQRLGRWRVAPMAPWYEVTPGEVRLFDPGHSLGFFFTRRTVPMAMGAYADLFHFLGTLAATCRQQGVEVAFALFPQRFQVHEADWAATVFAYGLDPAAFDVEAPNNRIGRECSERGLNCLDLLPAFRRHAKETLYLPLGDMHWNARGHGVAARALAEALLPMLKHELTEEADADISSPFGEPRR